MDLYRGTFAGSLLLNSFVLLQTYRSRQKLSAGTATLEKIEHRDRIESNRESLNKLKWRFFPIYLLVNAADWLQGPYIYPIYKGALNGFAQNKKPLTSSRWERIIRRDRCLSFPYRVCLRWHIRIFYGNICRSLRPSDSMFGILRAVLIFKLHSACWWHPNPIDRPGTWRSLRDSTVERFRKLASRRVQPADAGEHISTRWHFQRNDYT